MGLCTVDQVRRALGYTDVTLTDQAIQKFIEIASQWIATETGETYTESHTDYVLAQGCCIERAAYHCIKRPAGGVTEGMDYTVDRFRLSTSKSQESKKKTAADFEKSANVYLATLKKDSTDVPWSNTGSYG
jgi:hypothetical protein